MVVIGHGVTSHWDRPWQTELSAALSHAGIASVLVSFAGNGASEGRFEDVTPTKEVADLGSVLDALQAWGVTRLMYAGHSMGAQSAPSAPPQTTASSCSSRWPACSTFTPSCSAPSATCRTGG